jgi:polysaccharide deacetylase family protein (PEP-CTERM system associated)
MSTTAAVRAGLTVEPVQTTPPTDPAAPRCAFTVDVEDWYQSCVDVDARISERVVRNTDRLLGVLDDHRLKATFFVQGLVAETYPALVRSLVDQGHEVQSHGHTHRPLYSLSPADLRAELECARASVEDAAGTAVTAFRAQDFSIRSDNLWALDVLAEVGFRVDSSIFAMRLKRYGIRGWPVVPHRLRLGSGGSLLEIPVAIWASRGARLPVAGGGYFRVLPRRLLTGAVHDIARDRPAVVYCHPYEFNPRELDEYRNLIPRRQRMSQSFGRRSFAGRIRALLAKERFGRLDDVLAAWGIT